MVHWAPSLPPIDPDFVWKSKWRHWAMIKMAIILLFLAMHCSLYLDEIDKFVYHVPHSDSKERSTPNAAKETNKLERGQRFMCAFCRTWRQRAQVASLQLHKIKRHHHLPRRMPVARAPNSSMANLSCKLWNYYYYDQHDTYYTQKHTHTPDTFTLFMGL